MIYCSLTAISMTNAHFSTACPTFSQAEFLRRLRHPNIVQFYGAATKELQFWLITGKAYRNISCTTKFG